MTNTQATAERSRPQENSPASGEKGRNSINRLKSMLKFAGILGLAGLGVGGVGDLLGLWNLPGFSVTALGGLLTRIPGLNADMTAGITRTAGELSQAGQAAGEQMVSTAGQARQQLENLVGIKPESQETAIYQSQIDAKEAELARKISDAENAARYGSSQNNNS